jgi:transposase
MIFAGCSICQRPDVDAVNAALRTSSVRAVAAAFSGLSKSALGRHAKHADEPGSVLHPEAENQAPHVRHRTRPVVLSCATGAPGAAPIVIDAETRAQQALWMRQAGRSWRQIAAAFNVSEQTIADDIDRMRQAEIADARRIRAEDHFADVRASNRLIVAKLIETHDRAAAKGDERAALDAIKELRQVKKAEAEFLRAMGASDGFRAAMDRREQEAQAGPSVIDLAKDWMGAFAMDDTEVTPEDIQRLANGAFRAFMDP